MKLSVVEVVGRQRERSERGLEAILAQRTAQPFEVIIIDLAPDERPLRSAEDPRVRVVPHAEIREYPDALAAGAREAEGEFVAFLEDHCHAQPGWAMALEQDCRPHVTLVNYAFEESKPSTYLSRAFLVAQYGRWMRPTRAGPVAVPACTNVCYRRETLLNYTQERPLEAWFALEYLLHRRIRRDGGLMWQSEGAVVAHEDWLSLQEGMQANGTLKRYSAGQLAHGEPPWSAARRLVYACGMALVPALALWRLASSLLRRPGLRGAFLSALPVSVCVFVYGSWWEAVGYLAGPGNTGEALPKMEIERARK